MLFPGLCQACHLPFRRPECNGKVELQHRSAAFELGVLPFLEQMLKEPPAWNWKKTERASRLFLTLSACFRAVVVGVVLVRCFWCLCFVGLVFVVCERVFCYVVLVATILRGFVEVSSIFDLGGTLEDSLKRGIQIISCTTC